MEHKPEGKYEMKELESSMVKSQPVAIPMGCTNESGERYLAGMRGIYAKTAIYLVKTSQPHRCHTDADLCGSEYRLLSTFEKS